MKTRPIIILGIVAFIGLMAWALLAFTEVTPVPSGRFADTLRKQPEITIASQVTRAPGSLPFALRIRFPKQTSKGATGFIDRSDVYTLNSRSGDIECTAHVRRDKVCYVTLNGHDGVDSMRTKIEALFPGLPVD